MENILQTDSLSSTLPLDPLPNTFFSSSSFGLDPIFPTTPFHFPTFSPSSSSDNDNQSSSPSSSPDSPLPNSPISPSLVDGWNNGTSIIDPLGVTKTMSVRALPFDDLDVLDDRARVSQPPPLKGSRKRTQRNSKPTRGTAPKKGRAPSKKTVGTKRKRTLKSHSPSRSPSSSPMSDSPEREGKAVPVPSSQLRELLQDAVLKKQRLQRKAELARISRQKKQIKMSELESQVQVLEEENKRLKAQLASVQGTEVQVTKGEEENKKSLDKAVSELSNMPISPIDPTSSPSAPKKTLQQDEKVATLVGNVVQAFKEQSVNLEQALKVIEQALVPCTAIQFLEWSMIQKEKFYNEDGLFMSLFRDEMGATPQQIAQLLALRPQLQQQASKVKNQSLIDAFRAFETLLRTKGLQQPDSFNQLRAIFTPQQLAAYFKWVSLYGAVLIKVPV